MICSSVSASTARDFDAVLTRIEHSSSAVEQYQAMLVVTRMLDGLDSEQGSGLAEALRNVRGQHSPRVSYQISARAVCRVGRAGEDGNGPAS
jgi:hypothetical protein